MTHDYEKFNQALHLLNGRLELAGAPRFGWLPAGSAVVSGGVWL
jgi:hypothetical protein